MEGPQQPPPRGWTEGSLSHHLQTHSHWGARGYLPRHCSQHQPFVSWPKFSSKGTRIPKEQWSELLRLCPLPLPSTWAFPRQPALDPPSVQPYWAQAPVGTARDSLQASVSLSHSPRVCVTCCRLPAPPPRCAVGSWGQWKPLHKLIPTFSAALCPIHTFWGCLLAPALHETEPQAIASAIPKLELTFHCHSIPPVVGAAPEQPQQGTGLPSWLHQLT